MKTRIFSDRRSTSWSRVRLPLHRKSGLAIRQRPMETRGVLGSGTIGLPSGLCWLVLLLLGLPLHSQSVLQFTATRYDVTEGASQLEVIVQRTSNLDTVVSVDFTTTNLTAIAGEDYLDVSTNLTFLAGQTNHIVAVPILNDGLVEAIEIFQLLLSNPTGGARLGPRSKANGQITDNDVGLQVEFAQYRAREDEGAVLIGVLRGDEGDFTATVEYATGDGTALAGHDYSATSGKLEFAAGEKLKLFTIPILNDGLKEGNETFRLYLTNASAGVTLGTPTSAGITIADNDLGVQIELNTYWVQENEGTLTLSVLRGNDVDLSAYTVDYATTNLTAIAGEDYTETKGTLEFAAGETVKLLTIPIADDEVVEPDEKFAVTLSKPTGTSVLRSSRATVTILDATGAHRFDGVAVLPDHRVQLTLGGSVYPRIRNYLDLYPIEVSTDLVDWTPFITLQRTNSSTNVFTYTDSAAATSDVRFYRTIATHLITPFTQPTGPFAVGVISRLVTDPTRRNRYGVSTNGSFMVSIWYPAVAEAGKPPGRLQDDELSLDSGWWGTSPQVQLTSSALPDAPCATDQAPYPILLHSHGFQNLRWDAANKGPCFASHGYVVVAIDHWDAYGTVFPNGTYLHGSTAVISTAGFQDRVQDLLVVLDELARWNAIDPVLAGCLDATNVAASGWSWGGGVAAEACRRDNRCRAAIVLEGYMQNADDLLRFGLSKPFIGMYSAAEGGTTALYDKTTQNAVWFQISSSAHQDFSDYYWIQDPVGGREVARTINDYILWFLNKYLKGNQDPMPALAEYPRIINFKQK